MENNEPSILVHLVPTPAGKFHWRCTGFLGGARFAERAAEVSSLTQAVFALSTAAERLMNEMLTAAQGAPSEVTNEDANDEDPK